MNNREEILGKMDIKQALIKLSIPAIIGMLINAIYNSVDRIYVGRLGKEALAATNIVFPLFALIGAVGLTFGVGSSSYVSRLLGQGDKDIAQRAATTAIFSSFICGLIYTFIGIFFIVPILKFFGATPTALEQTIDYGKYLTIGAIFTMLNMTMNNLLRAEGNAKFAMIAMLVGAILNIVLDPIFIFTFSLGISGAAIATVLSQMVSTFMLFRHYLKGKSSLKLRFKYITFTTKIYGEIMKIGTPTFLRQVLASLSLVLVNHAAKEYGDTALASLGVINIVFLIAFYVLFGFNQGFQPIAGYSFGARNYNRLYEAIKTSITWTTVFCVSMTIIFLVFSNPIIRIFSSDKEVIELASRGLRYYSLILPFMGFIIIITGLFQALGYAFGAGVLSLSRQGLFLIPAIMILPKYYGLNGIIFSQPVADLLTLIITILFSIQIFKRMARDNKEIITY